MCGIAGFIDRQASIELGSRQLSAMLERIRHRGPDERGILVRPEVGCYVGMQRLSIIDLAGGQQPVWNENRSIAVVFNGEIYNYIELRRDLESAGHKFRTKSDTEVLVHLYEEHSSDMACKLRGMFVFAIIDLQRHQILIARDQFGQKPMYYYAAAGRFAFASEIKSLFELPFIPRDVDREAYLDYVSWFRLPAPRTHFKAIHKLPPGYTLEIDLQRPDEPRSRSFWQFEFDAEPELRDMDAAAEELEAAIDESVKLHLRSDVPVGVMLSGGLDSRVIAEFARAHYPQKLSTFAVAHEGLDSEGVAARASADAIGSQHFEVSVEASDLANSIEDVAYHLDEPVGDPAAFAVLKLCRFARNHVKVLLGGEGSDELFAGYAGRYQSILQQAHRSKWLRRFSGFLPDVVPQPNPSRWHRLCRRAHRSLLAEIVEARIEGFPCGPLARWGLTADQLHRLSDRAAELGRQLMPNQRDVLSTVQALDVRWQLAESLLLKSDKMSMAASLELRCPFLDTQVAAVARRISPELRLLSDGPGKLVLRECLRRRLGHLPELAKKGFPIPLDEWIRGPLREIVHESVFGSNSEATRQLDPQLLRQAWEAFLQGEPLGTVFYAIWLYEVWNSAIHPGSSSEYMSNGSHSQMRAIVLIRNTNLCDTGLSTSGSVP